MGRSLFQAQFYLNHSKAIIDRSLGYPILQPSKFYFAHIYLYHFKTIIDRSLEYPILNPRNFAFHTSPYTISKPGVILA